MVTHTNTEMEKDAAISLLKLIGPLLGMTKGTVGAYMALSSALGIGTGAALGLVAHKLKNKDPKMVALDRKKEFYDRQIGEIANENWLNDLMATKKKLETAKLTDEERTELENKYIGLINA